MIKTLKLVLIMLTPLILPLNAYADDETKRLIGGIAVGIIGHALNEISNQEEAQAEEINSNGIEQNKKSKAVVSEKTRRLQSDLKELGYYEGTVDGISGSGTQQAILKWEEENCLSDDDYCRNDKLDNIELDVIKDHAENKRNNRKITERNAQRVKQNAEEEKKITLEDLFYDQARNAEQYEICKNFKDNYANFSYSIDKNLEKNYDKFSTSNEKAVKDLVSCKSLSKQETAEIRDTYQDEYDESRESQLTRIRAGYVFTEDGEDRELILRCNLLSSYLKERSGFLNSFNPKIEDCKG